MLDTDLLRSFVAIADSGSFTRAAAVVGRSQSAVSMQIRRLEETVGKILLDRDAKPVGLTAEGARLLPHARRILHQTEAALAELREPGLSGSVRIGIPDDFALSYLPPILGRFCRAHPQVQVEITCDASVNLVRLLAEARIDLALATCGHGGREDQVICDEPVVWATSSRHQAHLERPLPLAMFQPGCQIRRQADEILERQGVPYRIAVVSPSIAGIHAAVEAGLAVTAIGRSSLLPGMRVLTAADGFPDLPPLRISLERGAGLPSAAAERLAEHVIESLRQPGLAA